MAREGRHEFHGDRRRRRTIVFGSLTIVLMIALGIGLAAQVRVNDSENSLDSARPGDLLVLLDNLGRREAALREDITSLQDTLATLQQEDGGSGAALTEARERLDALSVLVGTVPATGPGIVMTVEDPRTGVGSEVLVDALQELRAAGAETVQIAGSDNDGVRIGLDSWIAGSAGAVVVDGQKVSAPFVYTAVGDPATLAAALDIPGGVVDTVARNGGQCRISQSEQVTVSALRDP
ncbi:DUF881 domain-containing protein [Rhodococcus sp. 1163]|uniref:DUF881 domain-containing protein n=1 Tax=Rhodococcus sp. 1163 TaxID=1905289 RepID=UPI00211A9DAD|nr:DUF881 domain-containing protein [Rhodococcus sp. 1163]